jgi:hypothetical protein
VSREIVLIIKGDSTLYIDLESIISIKSYFEDERVYCPKAKFKWWNILGWIGLTGYECPKDYEVYVDYFGHAYYIKGKRNMMILFFASGKSLDMEWDKNIYSKWMKFAK